MMLTIENDFLVNCILLLPIIFVIVLSIIVTILNKKEARDLAKIIEENRELIDTSHNYKIYEKGRKTVFILIVVLLSIGIGITLLFKNTYGLPIFIIMLLIAILGATRHIPDFIFICPKCGMRKMKHKQKIINIGTSYRRGNKIVYLKCNSCGFQTIENAALPMEGDNDI